MFETYTSQARLKKLISFILLSFEGIWYRMTRASRHGIVSVHLSKSQLAACVHLDTTVPRERDTLSPAMAENTVTEQNLQNLLVSQILYINDNILR